MDVVYVHSGNQNYLRTSLEITGLKNNVILIGDENNKNLKKLNNIEFINQKELLKNSNIHKYKSYFTNYSTNPEYFEWLCFQRIFLIYELFKKLNISTIFHSDSDNVLLRDVNSIKFENSNCYLIPINQTEFDMVGSIHSSVLNKHFCEEFITLYEDIYINKTKFDLIAKKIEFHEKNNLKGGICDMTFYYLLSQYLDVQNLFLNTQLKNSDISIFIHDFKSSSGPNGQNTFLKNSKNIKIFKHYKVFDKINNEFLYLNNIHFQGISKKYLNKFTKFKLSLYE